MIKLRKFLLALFSVGAILLLSGCKYAILNPKGIIAAQEKQLLLDAVLLMLIVVIPAILLSLVFAWKYRASNTSAKYSPDWSHSTIIEIIVWSIPCAIIVTLAVITWITSHTLDPYKPIDANTKPLVIQAIALNWKWLFIYPDEKIATINYIQIPVNKPVEFLITADAPMNSFDLPQLGGQIYAMAGMQTKLNIMANQAGDYVGQSTNISGIGFSDMNFIVRAGSNDDYAQWVQKVQKSPEVLTPSMYSKLIQPSINNSAEFFTIPNGNLFANVLMKYMMPMSDTPGINTELASN